MPVLGDVPGDQVVLRRADRRCSGGEGVEEGVGDAGEVPAGVAVDAAVALVPGESELAGEVIGENGPVVLRQGDHRGVDRPAVKGTPPSVYACLDLAGDHDVGVELRIPRSGVEVIKRHRGDPVHVDLGYRPIGSVRPDAGRGHLRLEHGDDVVDGGMVRRHDLGLHLSGCQGPQDRHRL